MTYTICSSANYSPLSECDGFHITPLLVSELAAEAYPTTLVTEDESIC